MMSLQIKNENNEQKMFSKIYVKHMTKMIIKIIDKINKQNESESNILEFMSLITNNKKKERKNFLVGTNTNRMINSC